MKKVLLAGLCGLSIMTACVLASSNNNEPSIAGSGAYVTIRM